MPWRWRAATEGLPYACVPAGTRNHFALDLGVDREDVIGSLDGLVEGGERRVDLAEVKRDGYRDAKPRTLLEMAPAGLAGDTYRLGATIGSGTRSRLDGGRLGIIVVRRGRRHSGESVGLALECWQSTEFTAEAEAPMAAGIDGEAVTLSPPARFSTDRRPSRAYELE